MTISRGAGAFGAGLGSAGFDPVADPSESNQSSPPAALFFDPNTRDFRLGADGRFVATDPVDQEVVLALCVRFRSIGSSPLTGSTIRDMQRQGGPGFIGKVEDAVRVALRGLTNRNAITILKIDIDIRMRGRTYIAVTYRNNTLVAQSATPPTVTISV